MFRLLFFYNNLLWLAGETKKTAISFCGLQRGWESSHTGRFGSADRRCCVQSVQIHIGQERQRHLLRRLEKSRPCAEIGRRLRRSKSVGRRIHYTHSSHRSHQRGCRSDEERRMVTTIFIKFNLFNLIHSLIDVFLSLAFVALSIFEGKLASPAYGFGAR